MVSINKIRIHIFHLLSIACLLAFLNVPLNAHAKNQSHANTKVTLSSTFLTPGQQLSLEITVNYLSGVEVFLDLSQHNWQPFTLIEYKKSEPSWHKNQWHVTYVVKLIAPLAGEFTLAELVMNSYLQQSHQSLKIEIPVINVISSFPQPQETAELQPLQVFTAEVKDNSRNNSLIVISIVIALCLISLGGYLSLRHKNRQARSANVTKPIIIILDELIATAKESGRGDWQALRHYMLQHLGFDPLKEQNDSRFIELSNRYTSSRFTANSQEYFIALCQECLQFSALNKDTDKGTNIENKEKINA